MEPTSSSPSNCSRPIRLILSLWVLFSVLLHIPLGVEGESCSTSPSHYVECTDPNAHCKDETMTRYGSCQCPEAFLTFHLSDANSRYDKTECVRARAPHYSPCKSSLQCQFQDTKSLCSFEYGSHLCRCRDIDGYILNKDKTRCVHKDSPSEMMLFEITSEGSVWHIVLACTVIILVMFLTCGLGYLCFYLLTRRWSSDLVPFDRSRPQIGISSASITPSQSENGERPISVYEDAISQRSAELAPLNPIPDLGSSRLSVPHDLSYPQPRSSPSFEDAISQISSRSEALGLITFDPQEQMRSNQLRETSM